MHPTDKMVGCNLMFVLVVCCFSFSECARILAVAPFPSYSHQVAFRRIWIELSLKGHHVTLVTTDPIKDAALTNLTEIDIHDVTYDLWRSSGTVDYMQQNRNNPLAAFKRYKEIFSDLTDAVMEQKEVKALLEYDGNFDLVMAEPILSVGLGFAERFKSKLILVMSLEAPSYLHGAMGNPSHPVLYQQAGGPIVPKTYVDRIISSAIFALQNAFGYYFEDSTTKSLRKHFGEDVRALNEIVDAANMLFVNINPIFAGVRPLTPSTVYYGRGSHLEPKKPLPHVSIHHCIS